jgi:hypothetical protein
MGIQGNDDVRGADGEAPRGESGSDAGETECEQRFDGTATDGAARMGRHRRLGMTLVCARSSVKGGRNGCFDVTNGCRAAAARSPADRADSQFVGLMHRTWAFSNEFFTGSEPQ